MVICLLSVGYCSQEPNCGKVGMILLKSCINYLYLPILSMGAVRSIFDAFSDKDFFSRILDIGKNCHYTDG